MHSSYQVGQVKITRVVEFEVPVAWDAPRRIILQATPEGLRRTPWLYPSFVTEKDELMFAVQALVVQTPERVLVVDTCVGNDKPRNITGKHALQGKFLDELREIGCPREAVDLVVCTHLHVDHVGWNTMLQDGQWVPTFPRARYLIGRTEMEKTHDSQDPEQPTVFADSVQPVLDAGLVDLVEMDHVICPEVRLRPTPGHTPGHVSIEVVSAGKRALITGDFVHHPCQLANPTWHTSFDADLDRATHMRKTLLEEFADTDTLLIGTHFASPAAGYLRREGPDSYRLDVR